MYLPHTGQLCSLIGTVLNFFPSTLTSRRSAFEHAVHPCRPAATVTVISRSNTARSRSGDSFSILVSHLVGAPRAADQACATEESPFADRALGPGTPPGWACPVTVAAPDPPVNAAEQYRCRVGHQDLTAVPGGHHPRSTVEHRPEVVPSRSSASPVATPSAPATPAPAARPPPHPPPTWARRTRRTPRRRCA